MKKIVSLIFLLVFTVGAFAQTKPVALKFDEFRINETDGYYPYAHIDVNKRVERLRPLARLFRKDHFFVIYYPARKSDVASFRLLENWVAKAKNMLVYEWKVDEKNVVTVNGGYRDHDTIEFWIVPKGADAPVETPFYQNSEKFLCPRINIIENDFNFDPNRPAAFKVSTYPEQDGLTFKWSVSPGSIVKGVEDESVEIDPTGNKKVTLFVEVSGFPAPCERVAFKSFTVGKRPYLVDDLDRFNSSYYSALVDSFMIRLHNEPEMRGYIITYASRSRGTGGSKRLFAEARKPFLFRKYGFDRVQIIDGGYREFDSAELWLIPPGAEPPRATPSVDSKLVHVLNKKQKR